MKISMSEVGTFLRCRRKWSYSSENMRSLSPISDAPYLWIGTGVHAALEQFYRAGPDAHNPAEFFCEWALQQKTGVSDEREWDRLTLLGAVMLSGYLNEYGGPDDDRDGFTVLRAADTRMVEQEFQVPIPGTPNGILVGRADGLIRDAQGWFWLLDHKTYTPPPPRKGSLLVLDRQFLGYTWAFQMLSNAGKLEPYGVPTGARIEGALYNGLRKQQPGPHVTEPLFYRKWIDHSLYELHGFQTELAFIYDAMHAARRGDVSVYPTPSYDCSRCSYSEPCVAAQLGEDEAYLLETQYQRRPPRGTVYEREESE